MRTHVLNNNIPNLKQGEDRTNTIEILVPTDMRRYSLFLFFALPDGSKTFTPKLTMTDNKVSYVIPAGITAKTGRVTVELQGYLDNRLIKSVSYAFFVVAAVSTPTDPPFEDFVPWYLEVMQKADQVETDKSAVTAMKNQIKTDENQRQVNERVRQADEETRKKNEVLREQTAAEIRAYLDTFAANEVTRQQTAAAAESARAQTFTTNEAGRQSTFSANEATRETNETARKAAESSRLSAEQGRTTAETGRVDAESGRVTAEQGRAAFYDGFNGSLAENLPIKGTTQSVTFNPDGSVQKIEHKDTLNSIVRTDSFAYSDNLITEVRTTGSRTLTLIYHLDTFVTEVI